MKNISVFILICFSIITGSKSYAQLQIAIDPTFATGGKIEINLGGFNNEVTGFDAGKGKPTTICGKISTAIPGIYRFGMVRVDTGGRLDLQFGSGGTVNMSWSATDYPLDMLMLDPVIMLAGVSGASASEGDKTPTMYIFKKNGTPDSSFGTNGRVAMQFDDRSSGEATNIFNGNLSTYAMCGRTKAKENAGRSGFGVMKLKQNGTPDSSFGVGGRSIIDALVHSVHGYYLNDNNTLMCGISDTGKHELLLARFNDHGMPDSTAGINGLIHTGIFLTAADTMFTAKDFADSMYILLSRNDVSPTLLTIFRFGEHGILDTINYGDHGFGKSSILPSIRPRGLNILNDKSGIVGGITKGDFGHSIITITNGSTGRADPMFFSGGVAELDVDNGAFENYMKFMVRVGKTDTSGKIKKLIGAGGSVHNGIENFMISRFVTSPSSSVGENYVVSDPSISIYPDPASSAINIEVAGDRVKNIRITDALGRDIRNFGAQDYSPDTKIFSGNVSQLPNGIYYCIAQIGAQKAVRKFIVSH